ncbi:MAG: flagellar hook-basal body complex protein [Candidatus Zixiibacteriota bacterium]|nr:MAG: flagellar hook-basal body complex protein [candidate division Zixibacteria bacterium]
MMASLFAGVSGLRNHQVRMNVVGDNIANVNTIGYKAGRTTFQEALVQTLRGASRPASNTGGTNPLQLGLGMSVATIDNLFLQGGLETTGQVTDLGIQGTGFFVVSDGQQNFYTRAGAFGFDADSNMISLSTGYILQGKMADVDGTIPANAPIGNIVMPFGQQDPARETSEIEMGMNLNSAATDSVATMVSAGNSNVVSVSGYAVNGSGGQHVVTITGSNAQYSELSGVHANTLDDVVAGDVATVVGGGGTGTLPADDYVYTVIAQNSLGNSTGVEITVIGVPANGSVDLTITYADPDVTSIQIYRRPAGGTYGGTLGGKIYEGAYAAPGPLNFTDDGSQSGDGAIPPSINTTLTLDSATQLSAIGVTDVSGFRLAVDGGGWITLPTLSLDSTVGDLISAINASAPGVTASLENGEINIRRDYAGSPSAYNVVLEDTGTSDVCTQVFGSAIFNVNNGAASTLQVTDVFTPTDRAALAPEDLDLVFNPNTGIVTGISGLGGGGITIQTGTGGLVGDPDGIGPETSSTLIVDTAETQHATSITVYDSQGGKHNLSITFTKSWLNNQWFWEASFAGTETIRSGGSGVVNFNPDGSLASFTYNGGASSLNVSPNNGAYDMDMDLMVGTPGAFDGLTGFASTSTAAARSQNGYGVGILSNISIEYSGLINGIFTNGVSRVLARIYLAEFNNPGGLLKAGRSIYQESANTGSAIMSIPAETTSSTITSGALEISNVDLAQEFTNMIVSQRGFQANARVITTSDQMLTELVNLKS